MNPNSNETTLLMMVDSLEKKLQEQKVIYSKQAALVLTLSTKLEIYNRIIEDQKEAIDYLKKEVRYGYM